MYSARASEMRMRQPPEKDDVARFRIASLNPAGCTTGGASAQLCRQERLQCWQHMHGIKLRGLGLSRPDVVQRSGAEQPVAWLTHLPDRVRQGPG